MNTTTATRRAVLAGAAAMIPATGFAAALPAAGNADPIFAAIARLRAIGTEVDHLGENDETPEGWLDRYNEAKASLVRTVPHTPAGLAALTAWLHERGDECCGHSLFLSSEDQAAVYASLDKAVSGMAGLSPWQPPATTAEDDPIFAAIERHRAAYKAYGDALKHEEEMDLWTRIPEERRQWSADIWNPEPPADCTDDPEWIAHTKKVRDASHADQEALVSVVSTEPATIAGAVAQLNYCLEQQQKDYLVVSSRNVGNDEVEDIDLTATLLETLAAALPKIRRLINVSSIGS